MPFAGFAGRGVVALGCGCAVATRPLVGVRGAEVLYHCTGVGDLSVFWSDAERPGVALKEIKAHKHWISNFKVIEDVIDDLGVLLEFFDAGEATEEELDAAYARAVDIVDDVEFRSTLNHPEDELSCILEINAGAGGTESCDWSEMLLRMYVMWAEKNGYKVSELNRQNGDVAGIKSAEIEINGEYAYGMLKGENGVHRLVRVSPFNSQGKRMTSFSSVFVHPLIDDSIQIEIKTDDLEWDTFRSSGAGWSADTAP